MLRVGEWKEQLLVQVFHPLCRLARGELRNAIREWVETHHCSPRWVQQAKPILVIHHV